MDFLPTILWHSIVMTHLYREPAKRVKLDSSGGDQATPTSVATTTPVPSAPPTSVAMTTQQPDAQQQWAAAYQQQWAGAYAYGQPVSMVLWVVLGLLFSVCGQLYSTYYCRGCMELYYL